MTNPKPVEMGTLNNQLLPRHREDIQGLRAIAVILVILSHLSIPFFKSGFIGVDIFFTISGFLITGLLVGELNSNKQIDLVSFYSRRLKRLLPSLLTMILIIYIIAAVGLSNFEFEEQMGSSSYATAWISNFYFANSNAGYFSELQNRDAFIHTWSLAVEEQFYLIWPFLLLGSFHFFKEKSLFNLLIATIIISFALSMYWSKVEPLWSFYLTPSRIWQFAAGGLVFIITKTKPNLFSEDLKIYSRTLSYAGPMAILLGLYTINPSTSYPSVYAILPTLGTALILYCGASQQLVGFSKLLTWRPLIWTGDRSYSLYLWHWPIIAIGSSIFPIIDHNSAIFLITLIVITEINYRLIELPFWKGKLSNITPSTYIKGSLLAILISLLGIYLHTSITSAIKESEQVERTNRARVDLPQIYNDRCDSWYSSAEVVPCIYGNTSGTKTAVLLGDSIGAQWFSIMPIIFSDPDWKIIVLTKSACAIVDVEYVYKRIGKTYDVCTAWRSNAINYLAQIKPNITIVGSASLYEFTDQQWIEGTASVAKKLANISNKTIFIPGTPLLTFDGPACLANSSSSLSCFEDYDTDAANRLVLNFTAAIKGTPNTYVLDLTETVCPNGRCSAETSDGIIAFRDQKHLTNSFVESLGQNIHNKISTLILEE